MGTENNTPHENVHREGFEKLSEEFGGLEYEFNLSRKFSEEESEESQINPKTGLKLPTEQILVLSVSVQHMEWTTSLVLRYGLSSSRLNHPHPSETDKINLFQLAHPHIQSDLIQLKKQQLPDSLYIVRML